MRTLALLIALGLVVAFTVSAWAQPSPADVRTSARVIMAYRLAVARNQSLIEPAHQVCRLAFSEALRGLDLTGRQITEYHGEGEEVLSLICNGYLRGATDVLTATPPKKEGNYIHDYR